MKEFGLFSSMLKEAAEAYFLFGFVMMEENM